MFLTTYKNTNHKRSLLTSSVDMPRVTQKAYGKSYPRFPHILLPPASLLNMPLDNALTQRRSLRKNVHVKVPTMSELSSLLFYTAGIITLPSDKNPLSKRTYPSAGARYPLELYLYLRKPIGEISPSTYHYQPHLHILEKLPIDIDDKTIKECVLIPANNFWLKECWGVIFISAVYQRTEIKYGAAAFRLIHLEAGHMVQNLYLASTALGVGCCALGGLSQDKLNAEFLLDTQKEVVVYGATLT